MNLNLHHIGVLVRDIPEAADRYLRIGYKPTTQIVHDQTQTVYAQFFKLPEDRVYLELVSPDRPDSTLSNALKKGGGLNHLCYSTEDIEAACQWLGSTGSFLISPPVATVAFPGRRIAWLRSADRVLTELLESGPENEL